MHDIDVEFEIHRLLCDDNSTRYNYELILNSVMETGQLYLVDVA